MHCKDCKYWQSNGFCDAINNHDPGFGWKQNPDIEFSIKCVVNDDSGLDVWLKTGPKFGCIRFEKR